MKKIILLFFTIASCYANAQTINWSTPIEIAPSSYSNDYPRIVLDGAEQPLVSWGGANKIHFSKWTGTTFSTPIQLNNDTTAAYVASWTGADMAARNDTIYVGFMHQDWGRKTYLVRSFDGGMSFSTPSLLENYSNFTSRFPTIAINQAGQPLVGIMKMTSAGHHPHFVVRQSEDFGMSFTAETSIITSGQMSEACDCCPASMSAAGENVALFYRDNKDNVRDVWAATSSDGGIGFNQGFAVDNSNWEIFSCPASGPDGVVIGDSLYAVFFSDGQCYLSRSDITTASIKKLQPLSAGLNFNTQNFPRIANRGNAVVIAWKETDNQGPKLKVLYTEDITSDMPFQQETVYFDNFASVDVALAADGIHLVWEDTWSGTVNYVKGTFSSTSLHPITANPFVIYPNPATTELFISTNEAMVGYKIWNAQGVIVVRGETSSFIDISMLPKGIYFINTNQNQSPLKFVIKK